MILVH